MPTSQNQIEVIPTGAALGAEVRGVDLSQPIDAGTADALRRAWAGNLILLFRGQRLTDPQLIAASRIFGELQIGGANKYYARAGIRNDGAHVNAYPEITPITNVDADGKPVERNAGLGSLEVDWHSDNSYVETPPAGSMLYGIEVPENAGGETWFNNQYIAYETLSDDLKRAAAGRLQVHDSSRNSAGVLRPTAKLPTCSEEVEGPTHPLVRRHPVTGRLALYLGRRRIGPSNYIVGLSDEESRALLGQLWAHATQDQFAWGHRWKTGDVVLWDNRCAMHYRTPIDPTRRRIMHRTQIAGEKVVPAEGSTAAAA